MAPIYSPSKEIDQIVLNLVTKRDDLFGGVEADMIVSGLRVDKPAPAKQKDVLKIEGIRGSKTLLTEKKYLIHGYASMWSKLNMEKKVAHVANMLKRIAVPTNEELAKLAEKSQDFEWGKLRKPDVTDWRTFIQELGVGWADDDTEIPNLAESKKVAV